MRLVALPIAVVLLVVCTASASARSTSTLNGYGLNLALPHGWHGIARPGQLQAADFPLAPTVLGSPERAHVPRGHVHLVVWDYGPEVPYLDFQPARNESGGSRVLRASGRRFRVEIAPLSARRRADAVLATLRATARN